MKRLALILIAGLALLAAATSSGAVKHRHGGAAAISITAPRGATVARSETVPASARLAVYISFNGQDYQAEWSDTPNQIEYAWRGVVVVVSTTRQSGPATIQVASARWDTTQVHVRFVW